MGLDAMILKIVAHVRVSQSVVLFAPDAGRSRIPFRPPLTHICLIGQAAFPPLPLVKLLLRELVKDTAWIQRKLCMVYKCTAQFAPEADTTYPPRRPRKSGLGMAWADLPGEKLKIICDTFDPTEKLR